MDVAAMTLDAYLDEWLVLLRKRVQPTSYRSYDDMIDAYLRPGIGPCLVGELTVRGARPLRQGPRRVVRTVTTVSSRPTRTEPPMPRTATTEALARALHVGPAAVRKYARQGRVPFDTTPGGHRRFDVDEAVAALAGGQNERNQDGAAALDEGVPDVPYVRVQPAVSVTVTCSTAAIGDAPVRAYDTADDQEAWTTETTVV